MILVVQIPLLEMENCKERREKEIQSKYLTLMVRKILAKNSSLNRLFYMEDHLHKSHAKLFCARKEQRSYTVEDILSRQ